MTEVCPICSSDRFEITHCGPLKFEECLSCQYRHTSTPYTPEVLITAEFPKVEIAGDITINPLQLQRIV